MTNADVARLPLLSGTHLERLPRTDFDLARQEAAAALSDIRQEEATLARRKAKAIGLLDWNSALAAIQIQYGSSKTSKELFAVVRDFAVELGVVLRPDKLAVLDSAGLKGVADQLNALAEIVGNHLETVRIATGEVKL